MSTPLTNEQIATCHPYWLAQETHARREWSPAMKERMGKLSPTEFTEYLDAKDRIHAIDERKARIESKKKWAKNHPWEGTGQYALGDSMWTSAGDSLYTRNLGVGAGLKHNMEEFLQGDEPIPKADKSNLTTPDVSKRPPLKRCCTCHNDLDKLLFSYNQWSKLSPKCRDCIKSLK